ncbi:non-ribosomal peptide synthetase [Teredinibacter purpureus]|uniref:non-ribosomal peptide synthetase n=1 Tax=Teredinibacter purpureus TaxID=2731756 RepID=UPI0005F76744|nr:non-ribosomal peptide synthetase [Teredinibacter purpureus]
MKANRLLRALFKAGADVALEDGRIALKNCDNVSDEILEQVRETKSELIELLKRLDRADRAVPMIGDDVKSGEYESPVVMAQESMLFMEELSEGETYYNIPTAYTITGELSLRSLSASIDALVQKHDVLRSTYEFKAGKYVRKIGVAPTATLQLRDLTVDVQFESETLKMRLQDEANYCFDLSVEIPIRVVLFKIADEHYILSLNIHHIAADGWSAKQIVKDISDGYAQAQTISDTDAMSSATSDYCYADFAHWNEDWRDSKAFVEAEHYWLESLADAPDIHSVATDYPRPAVLPVTGDTYRHTLSLEIIDKLKSEAKAHNTTTFTLLQAAFAGFIARYSGESDIVFGTAMSNRNPVEFVETVGLFANTLALRYNAEQTQSFSELVAQAKDVSQNAQRFQQYPFDALVNAVCPVRSLSCNPIVQIMLVMQEDAARNLDLDGVSVALRDHRQNVSKFDFTVHCFTDAKIPRLEWEFNTHLFSLETIIAMSEHFECILDQWLTDTSAILGHAQFSLVAPLKESSLAPLDEPIADTLHHSFLDAVQANPSAIAVREGERSFTYADIDRQSDAVAQYLHTVTEGESKPIGVCLERSVELIVAMLGIFKQGSIYVPLDFDYPTERINRMVDDANTSLIIVDNGARAACLPDSADIVMVSTILENTTDLQYPLSSNPELPAYVIYTSGSTGAPKGVLVPHKSLFHSLKANAQRMNFTENDSMPTVGSQAFGVSLLEILLPLTNGGVVEIIPKVAVKDLSELIANTQTVTVFHAVPSLMQQWLDNVKSGPTTLYPNLRLLLVGGEAVSHELLEALREWRPNIQILELYGMTESSVVCSSYEPTAEKHAHYCIGRPHSNAFFYVLNEHLREQPIGVPGELYIGGQSLANGYLNKPDVTAQSFVDSPFLGTKKLYKTGDRVRCLRDGHYEFLGRVDNQVSLRGVRIELGEIETLVDSLAFVQKAIAQVMTLANNEKTLVLFFVGISDEKGESSVQRDAIREHLSAYLPDHMRPSIIQSIERFPLNPNGKVDRKKLPLPTISSHSEAPDSSLEHEILALWAEVLGRETIGVTDNFFEIGGHSLMASKLVAKLRAKYEVDLPLKTMFEASNVRLCAGRIEKALQKKFATELIISDHLLESDFEELAV